MKSKTGWTEWPNDEWEIVEYANTSRFGDLPGGFKSGIFFHEGMVGQCWSATEGNYNHEAWPCIYSLYDDLGMSKENAPKSSGLSVRCIKD